MIIKQKRFLLTAALIIFALLLIIQVKALPTGYIPLPDGNEIIVDNDNNNHIVLANPDEFMIVSQDGQTLEYRRKIDVSGIVLEEEGEDITNGAVEGRDKDTGLYDQAYDPYARVFLTTLGREFGSSLLNLGLNIISLGWYGNYQKWQSYDDVRNVPYGFGEIGLQTLDMIPVVGSVKAGIQAKSGLEASGHYSTALGTGILIVTPFVKTSAPTTTTFGPRSLGAAEIGTKLHPKIEKAMGIIESGVGPGYNKIYETLLTSSIKKMPIFKSILHKNFFKAILRGDIKGIRGNVRKGLYYTPDNIEVITTWRTPKGIARTLIHEGYHEYTWQYAIRYRRSYYIGRPEWIRAFRYFKRNKYEGLAEYTAHRVAGHFSVRIGFKPRPGGPYGIALQGRYPFRDKVAIPARLKWDPSDMAQH